MRRLAIAIGCAAILAISLGLLYRSIATQEARSTEEILRKMISTRSDKPGPGLPSAWFNCLRRLGGGANFKANRVVCETWTFEGLQSDLVALRIGDKVVPVLESKSRLNGNGKVVVDVTGGPGGHPFYVKSFFSGEQLEKFRRAGFVRFGVESISAYIWLLDRGFTLVSVGYWGTNFRILNVQSEIDLAIADVATAYEFYREAEGSDPPLIMTSLGNHLVLGALGRTRLEQVPFLSVVPAMDGLQDHLTRKQAEFEHERLKDNGKSKISGSWTSVNIYARTEQGFDFGESRMISMSEFVPRFIGKADLPLNGLTPEHACSRIVLGTRDPRTAGYLARNHAQPDFISVLDANHDVFEDSPERMREIFEDYANCLVAK